jgi:hypothetical protein
MGLGCLVLAMLAVQPSQTDNMDYLHAVAKQVLDSAMVLPGESITNGGRNTTVYTIRVPGGTQSYYPAFWVRDAAMMLGADLVPANEVEGWIRVVAGTQPGPSGIEFPHGLHIPPFSIPDHVTLQGEACWFPGAYANQGVGDFGFLPPADDAFYFIQMVSEHARLKSKANLFLSRVETGWGVQALSDVCEKAFDSVAVDPATGLVTASDLPGQTRVDWGFCDSIQKSGSCLMPSLLRWQAALRLERLFNSIGRHEKAQLFRKSANLIQASIPQIFYRQISDGQGMLTSATELGKKDDIWASAFAVWLHVLPKAIEVSVARGLLEMVQHGGIIQQGQVRHLPVSGDYGGFWERAKSTRGTYQNGGYWATPLGWLIVAIQEADRTTAHRLFGEYLDHLRSKRAKGAPFEWINPETNSYVNGNYGSSVGLVFASLTQDKWR